MQHPDDGLIEEYLDGELASPERAELEAHLAGCATCRERVETSRRFLAEASRMIEDLGDPAPSVTTDAPPASPPARLPAFAARRPAGPPARLLAWAATIAIAAGLGYASGTWRARLVPAPPPASPPARQSAEVEPPASPPARLPAESGPPVRQPAAEQPAARDEDRGRLEENVPSSRRSVVPSDGRAVAPSDFAKSAAANAAPPTAGPPARRPALEDAVRLLGGSIRLIDGMEVEKVEIEEAVVVLTYRDAAGNPIELRQSRPLADLAREALAAEPQRRLAAADRAERERAAAPAPAPAQAPAAGALDAGVMKDKEEDGGLGWTDSAGFRLLLKADADADSLRKIRARIR